MTLSFSTRWPDRMGELAGQPNYFIEKIWMGLPGVDGFEYGWQEYRYTEFFGKEWDKPDRTTPKLHTIRRDEHNRWKPGMKIHPVINNRTPDRFQFAPVIECKSVQRIEIKWSHDWEDTPLGVQVLVFIDGELFSDLDKLAINDGFPSVEAFFQYFNTDFKGNLIHWTDLKY